MLLKSQYVAIATCKEMPTIPVHTVMDEKRIIVTRLVRRR
jgi:hypothetical protein